MKKNIKGFTLVELLAVIVILAIIMTIAGTNLIGTRKKANIEEAKSLENTITKIGEDVYVHENMLGKKEQYYFNYEYQKLPVNGILNITIGVLKDAGYLKGSTISNPSGNGTCEGYLEIKKTNDGPKFKGYICCLNLYQTDSSDEPTNCSSYVKTNSAKLTELE